MRRLLLCFGLLASAVLQASERPLIDVHRDAHCGCCKDWIAHLLANGFDVREHVETDMSAVKQRLGVPYGLGSCHTAVIDGKFVEGHVPAREVLALRKRPDLLGAAVPGMPMGSPGMEMGNRHDAYQVIGVDRQGHQQLLNDYPGD